MANKYWIGDGGNWLDTAHWSTSSGGSGGAGAPGGSDVGIFDTNSFTGPATISFNGNDITTGSIDLSGIVQNVTFESAGTPHEILLNGDFLGNPNVTWNPQTLISPGAGTVTVYSFGMVFQQNFDITGLGGGTVVLFDDLVSLDLVVLGPSGTNCTLDMNGNDITCQWLSMGGFAGQQPTLDTGGGDIILRPVNEAYCFSDANNPATNPIILGSNCAVKIYLDDLVADSVKFFTSSAYSFGSIQVLTSIAGKTVYFQGDDLTADEFDVDPDAGVEFSGGSTYSFTDIFAQGTDGHLITFFTDGTAATLNADNSATFAYVDVANMTATGAASDFVDVNGVNSGGNTDWIFPPTATGISPSSGSADGGTTVTITGTNFVTGATSVTIGADTVAAGSVTVVSETELTFSTPGDPPGEVDVTVTNAAGTSSPALTYEYISVLPTYAASLISAVARVAQNMAFPQFVFGGRKQSGYALFKKSTTYLFHLFRDKLHIVGSPFTFEELRFSIHAPLATNMSIIPVLYFDGASRAVVGTTISTALYETGQTYFKLGPSNFDNDVRGKNDFFVEFRITGTVLACIKLPIEKDVDIDENP